MISVTLATLDELLSSHAKSLELLESYTGPEDTEIYLPASSLASPWQLLDICP